MNTTTLCHKIITIIITSPANATNYSAPQATQTLPPYVIYHPNIGRFYVATEQSL